MKSTEEQPAPGQGLARAWRTDFSPCIPARYVLAFASSLGFVNVYALRVNLSVAIVQMDINTASVTNESARTFDWTSQQTGWILSSFFFGYLITQVPGGWLAARYSGRWIFGIGIVMTAVFTLLTPVAAYLSFWALIAVRVAEGFFEGVTLPAMHAIWAKWAPPSERSILTTITFAGSDIGNILCFPLSAVLCQYGFDGGWPSVFYVFGAVGILWFALWFLVGFSSPATHPRISSTEKTYIEDSIAAEGEKEEIPVPWFKIMTSPAVWGIIIAHTCNNWGFYTLLTCMPTYFKQALPSLQIAHSNSVVLSGVYSAIPYILLAFLIPTGGLLADLMRKFISTTIVRKIMTSSAFIFAGSFLLICGYLGTTSVTAVVFLTIAVGSLGLALSGFACNHLDIAPRYGGVLMGISNMAATIPGIIGPYVAKAIALKPSAAKGTDEYLNTYRDEWREVFIISAEIYAFGLLAYIILASGKEQEWANGWPPPRKSMSCVSSTDSIDESSKFGKGSVQAGVPPLPEKTKLVVQPHSVDYGSV